MTPLEPGSPHNLLSGRTIGDGGHPQFALIKMLETYLAGLLLPVGTEQQTLYNDNGTWKVTDLISVDDVNTHVTFTGIGGVYIAGSLECTGTLGIHGVGEVEKLSVKKVGPGATIFSVDTSNDLVELFGNLVLRRVAIAASPYTVLSRDTYLVNTGAALTLNLPTSASRTGRALLIKNRGTGNITVTPNGADTIDGVGAAVVLVPLASAWFIANGTADWEVA